MGVMHTTCQFSAESSSIDFGFRMAAAELAAASEQIVQLQAQLQETSLYAQQQEEACRKAVNQLEVFC